MAIFIMFLQKLIQRVTNIYEWRIKTSRYYIGRFGIVDDTNRGRTFKMENGYMKTKMQFVLALNIKVGTEYGTDVLDLKKFVHHNDIISIKVNYNNNTITFTSSTSSKTTVKQLKTSTNSVRFVAEFYDNDSTMNML